MPDKTYNIYQQDSKTKFTLVGEGVTAFNADAATDLFMEKKKLETFKGFAVATSNQKDQDVKSEVETKTKRVRGGAAAKPATARKKPGPKAAAKSGGTSTAQNASPGAAKKPGPKPAAAKKAPAKRGAAKTGARAAKKAPAKPAADSGKPDNPFL